MAAAATTTPSAIRLWLSKLEIPAAVSRTITPAASTIITTSAMARWSFIVSVSLPIVGKAEVLRLESVTSTQDVARDLPLGSIVIAEHQTAGRGRLERRWEAPAGSALLVSFVLEPNPLLSLAAGVAAAEACGPKVTLKWPNDLLVGERKLGGILVETTPNRAICVFGNRKQRWSVRGSVSSFERRGTNGVLDRSADSPAQLKPNTSPSNTSL